MSRIGKKPILIPEGVEVVIDGNVIKIKGPKGELQREVRPEIKIEKKDKEIFVIPQKETKKTNAFWGLFRSLIFNMIEGVTKGYKKTLEMHGVGYKANLEGDDLILNVGFSHQVKIEKVEGIKFEVEKTNIIVSGIDKQLVGQVSAKIRAVKKPEPYKGKGIRYQGEHIRRKAGKKASTTEG